VAVTGATVGAMRSMLERLTEAQNAHDAERMASCFADDYRSSQPTHPGRAFTGRAQVLANWTAVFRGVPDFRAELVAHVTDGATEWGELSWHGHHTDGSTFAMRGVIVLTLRDDLIAEARLYVEPVERDHQDIDASVETLYRPPPDASHPERAGGH
jgi:ketosteroid isomerase-like protein